MRAIVILPVLFASLGSAFAQETPASKAATEMLVTAKFSGACAIIGQMIKFQADTKMPGGDEFLVRFLNTESARLGFGSRDEYIKMCTKAASAYQFYYDALDSDKASDRSP